jgi:hypothetical protein
VHRDQGAKGLNLEGRQKNKAFYLPVNNKISPTHIRLCPETALADIQCGIQMVFVALAALVVRHHTLAIAIRGGGNALVRER